MGLLTFLSKYRRYLIVLITPIILLPLPLLIGTNESKGAYGLLLIAIYWITEAFPIPVTAMMPLVLFPLMGVATEKRLATAYCSSATFILIGGMGCAIAIEKWNLHRRFALKVLLLIGSDVRRLMLGFMISTGVLSMWISNTAATAMMIPIAQAVLVQLIKIRRRDTAIHEQESQGSERSFAGKTSSKNCLIELTSYNFSLAVWKSIQSTRIFPTISGHWHDLAHPKLLFQSFEKVYKTDEKILNNHNLRSSATKKKMQIQRTRKDLSMLKITDSSYQIYKESPLQSVDQDVNDRLDFDELDLESKKLCKMTCLCVCYAASCGGIATLTGSGTNLVMKGQTDRFSDGQSGITFSSWFVFGFPVAFTSLLSAWLTLQVYFLGFRETFSCKKKSSSGDVKKILLLEYERLGPVSFAEKGTIGHFVLLLLLWFFQEPEIFTGWSSIFPKGYVGNGVPSILILCSLFIFPNGISRTSDDFIKHGQALLNWNITSAKMPWGTIILLGGGFALASACETSGLSLWLADQLSVLSTLPIWVMSFLVNLIASLATEVTSNVAITTILMPILFDLAIGIHVHPVHLLLPAAISTSFAFMLPVATPPNTIVFSYGYLKVFDMVRVGFILNLICVIVITIAINTYGRIYFNLDEIPQWAVKRAEMLNTTLVINGTSTIIQ